MWAYICKLIMNIFVKKRQYHYEVFTLPINESMEGERFIPFNIVLPNDVDKVVGLIINSDVKAQISSADTYNMDIFPEALIAQNLLLPSNIGSVVADALNEAKAQYKKDNLLRGKIVGFFDTLVNNFNGRTEIKLDKYRLGTISLKTYEESDLFYSQDINPDKLGINIIKENSMFGTLEGVDKIPFFIKPLKKKSNQYLPVFFDGVTREIFGFYRPTEFGTKFSKTEILTTNNDPTDVYTDHVEPYTIRIYLQCTLKK